MDVAPGWATGQPALPSTLRWVQCAVRSAQVVAGGHAGYGLLGMSEGYKERIRVDGGDEVNPRTSVTPPRQPLAQWPRCVQACLLGLLELSKV